MANARLANKTNPKTTIETAHTSTPKYNNRIKKYSDHDFGVGH